MFARFAPDTAVAAPSLALLTACGDASAAEPAASPTPQGQERKYRIEAIIADCMKQKGFRYVPYIPPPAKESEEELKRESGDYAAMKAYREKYGFGVWASIVYPKEFGNPAAKPDNAPVDPNRGIQASLSATQLRSYRNARDTCNAKAVKEVTGTEVTGSIWQNGEQINKRIAQLRARELDGDPQLADLAARMASCLRSKGYQVQSATPSALGDRGEQRHRAELNRIAQEKTPQVKDTLKRIKNAIVVPNMTADEARPYLAREIKEALDDLECGKDFYPVYAPRSRDIDHRVYAEFGMGG